MIQGGEVFKVAGLLLALWMVLFLKWLRPGILGLLGSTGLGVGLGFGLVFLFSYNVRRKKALNDGVRPALGNRGCFEGLGLGVEGLPGSAEHKGRMQWWTADHWRRHAGQVVGCKQCAQLNGLVGGAQGQAEVQGCMSCRVASPRNAAWLGSIDPPLQAHRAPGAGAEPGLRPLRSCILDCTTTQKTPGPQQLWPCRKVARPQKHRHTLISV